MSAATRRAGARAPVPAGTAVCCSGGGIRSACFNLGALQVLQDRGILAQTDNLIAVSGGAYLAAARSLAAAKSVPAVPAGEVYGPGSPEETHLRDNSRYLAPDARVALRGAALLLAGLAFNLALLLGWVFILGHLDGWLLHRWRLVTGLQSGRAAWSARSAWMVPAGLGAIAAVALVVRSRWSTRAMWWATLAAVIAALALLVAPFAVKGLNDVAVHDGGNLGTVVRGIGFATPEGCREAIRSHQTAATVGAVPADQRLCGVRFDPYSSANAATAARKAAGRSTNTAPQGGGLAAFFVALAALVRGALGRLRGQKPRPAGSDQGSGTGLMARIKSRVSRLVLPWAGSGLVVAVLALVWLRWAADGAVHGWSSEELGKVLAVLGGLAVARLVTDVNHTSMHRFYADRLAAAYGVVRRGAEAGDDADARLSDLVGVQPNLVLCGAANIAATGEVPPGRGAYSFSFAPERMGLSGAPPAGTGEVQAGVPGRRDWMAGSDVFEKAVGARLRGDVCDFGLFDAVAVSGAAVAPMMGKMTRRPQRILFTIANVRLGLWLPHPEVVDAAQRRASPEGGHWREKLMAWVLGRRLRGPDGPAIMLLWRFMQPNVRLLIAEAIGRSRLGQSWIYVSDGGHYDNLGLVEAFRRGADVVYVFDASGDKVTSWSTLGQAMALARSETGVEVSIDPTEMVVDGAVARPWVKGTFTYTWSEQPRPPGTIFFCKLGVWPGAPWDVRAYAARHPGFPCDSTIQQLYDDDEFEAYRALGHAATTAMVDEALAVRHPPPR